MENIGADPIPGITDGATNHVKPSLVLPADILNDSPSHKDGVKPADEVVMRVFGCELIQEAGILLDLYVTHRSHTPYCCVVWRHV